MPEMAAHNWDRWLQLTGNQSLHDQVRSLAPENCPATLIFGGSQQQSEVLIQNPELVYSLLDDSELRRAVTREEVLAEAERLLKPTNSPSHALDRVRYLKQWLGLRTAARDLLDLAPQPEIWRELSDLADGILAVTRKLVWDRFAEERGLSQPDPVAIIAFGKLGGHEINYSSDVDLVYVVDDDVPAPDEKEMARIGERYGRALQDQMGRGALYRVDLRLRPFGRSGPLHVGFSAWRNYYLQIAEPWEILAFIRSRLVFGREVPLESLREEVLYERPHGDWIFDRLLEERAKVEDFGGKDDLKRGAGGIRDVEFLAQIFQLSTAGSPSPNRSLATLDALAAAPFDSEDRLVLAEDYIFLRKLEHRIQLGEGLQTHSLPNSEYELRRVSRQMGFAGPSELKAELAERRHRVRSTFLRLLGLGAEAPQPAPCMEWAQQEPVLSDYSALWIKPGGAQSRLTTLKTAAPWLLKEVLACPPTLEQVLTGEIEENRPTEERADHRVRRLAILTRGVLGIDPEPWKALSELAESHFLAHLPNGLGAVALGSFANRELGPESDLDVVLVSGSGDQGHDEAAAEHMVRQWPSGPFALDLRLRPEGQRGLLAPTDEMLKTYGQAQMEDWERLSLRRSRVLAGGEPLGRTLEELATFHHFSDVVASLQAMKERVERERCQDERDLKLGPGGLDDLQWAVQLRLAALTRPSLRSTEADLLHIGATELLSDWQALMTERFRLYGSLGPGARGADGALSAVRNRIRAFLQDTWSDLRSK